MKLVQQPRRDMGKTMRIGLAWMTMNKGRHVGPPGYRVRFGAGRPYLPTQTPSDAMGRAIALYLSSSSECGKTQIVNVRGCCLTAGSHVSRRVQSRILPDVAGYGLIGALEEIAMTTSFQDASKTCDLLALRAIPKSDLHNHAVAGRYRPLVSEWAGRDMAPLDRPLASMAEMDAWVADGLGSLFSGPAGRLRAFEATFVQARYDGVTRLEVGEDVWAITLFEHDPTRLTSELISLHARAAPAIEWIPQLGLSQHYPIRALIRWLAPFFELGIYRTLGLYGDEFEQPIESFRPLYRMAQRKGLRLKAHVGEWGSEDEVWRAVEELELDEVQHGIAAAGSSAVMRMLADNQVRLNVCPTSKVMLGRVDRLETHQIRRLYDAGIKVTVNTDDVRVFGNGVSEESLSLYQVKVFDADEPRRNSPDGIERVVRLELLSCLHRWSIDYGAESEWVTGATQPSATRAKVSETDEGV